MTELLDEKMRVVRIVLENPFNYPMRRTQLKKAVLEKPPTPWNVHAIIKRLRNRSLIVKIGTPNSKQNFG